MSGWNLQKIKQMLSNTLRLNFAIWKLFTFFIHVIMQKVVGNNKKKCAKNKCVRFNEIILLMTIKMRMKMKNKSHRYDINRPRPRHEHKYTKYKICLVIMMVICIKQHLRNISSSIHTTVKQYWGWVEESVAYKKSVYCHKKGICYPCNN